MARKQGHLRLSKSDVLKTWPSADYNLQCHNGSYVCILVKALLNVTFLQTSPAISWRRDFAYFAYLLDLQIDCLIRFWLNWVLQRIKSWVWNSEKLNQLFEMFFYGEHWLSLLGGNAINWPSNFICFDYIPYKNVYVNYCTIYYRNDINVATPCLLRQSFRLLWILHRFVHV